MFYVLRYFYCRPYKKRNLLQAVSDVILPVSEIRDYFMQPSNLSLCAASFIAYKFL